jgi:hypothetical protein
MEYQDFYIDFLKGIYPAELSREDKIIFFIESCYYGHLEVAQWLWSTSNGTIDIHAGGDFAFRNSCGNGNLNVAQWLWCISNGTIDIHAYGEDAFRDSCENGYLEVTQWLESISNRSIYKIGKKTCYYQSTTEITIYYIKHHYYKPYTGPGYLHAIREDYFFSLKK